ncbi:MAG TPA: Type 1 glutamine amidotransferase-like domain-containing protein [Acidimicrobiia bacterium]|nr:Type 1 glutamine amidotransferase-like domain-containing protein [Acidimicrobiia bacterium]
MPGAKGSVRGVGTLALIGGGEWTDECRGFDTELLAASGADEVVVLPTAAAFEHPDRVAERGRAYLESLGVSARPLMVLHRGEAEDAKTAESVRRARFVYLADGSPLHLRSVLKDSALFEAMLAAYHAGGVLAASGAGATLLCDPMVDPRGGAYTVGLGVVAGLAVFPYHGSAADHLRERSIDLLPDHARLVGIDEHTALLRDPDGTWRVGGAGAVTVYQGREAVRFDTGSPVERLDDL